MVRLDFDFSGGSVSRLGFAVDNAGGLMRTRSSSTISPGFDAAWLEGLPTLAGHRQQLWVVIGQSQAVGLDTGVSPFASKTAGVLEVRHADQALIAYEAPGENDASGTNFAEAFAVSVARLTGPHIIPVVYNLAVGGTGFHDNRWAVGGDLLTSVTASIQGVLAANPSMTLGGFLWHQGRRDRDHSATYEADLLASIAHFQSLGSKPITPFILGTLEQSLVDSDVGAAAVNAAIVNAADASAGRVVVDLSDRLAGADGVHFDTSELVVIGHQYASAYSDWCATVGEDSLSGFRLRGRNSAVFV